MKIRIAHLFPDQLGLNGEVGNVTTLVKRLQWRGFDVEVDSFGETKALSPDTNLIFIGSGTVAGQLNALEHLLPMSTQLSDLNEAGVPILAVGAGWELLGKSLELVNGSIVETLGFFPSKSRHVPVRASCESYGHDFKGNLTAGYSNHSAEIELEEGVSPLVSLLAGNGNSSITDAKTRSDEGLIHSNLMASRLNGPLLPLNPHLADHLLMIGLERVGASLPESTPEMEIADGYAYRAREGIEKRLAR